MTVCPSHRCYYSSAQGSPPQRYSLTIVSELCSLLSPTLLCPTPCHSVVSSVENCVPIAGILHLNLLIVPSALQMTLAPGILPGTNVFSSICGRCTCWVEELMAPIHNESSVERQRPLSIIIYLYIIIQLHYSVSVIQSPNKYLLNKWWVVCSVDLCVTFQIPVLDSLHHAFCFWVAEPSSPCPIHQWHGQWNLL